MTTANDDDDDDDAADDWELLPTTPDTTLPIMIDTNSVNLVRRSFEHAQCTHRILVRIRVMYIRSVFNVQILRAHNTPSRHRGNSCYMLCVVCVCVCIEMWYSLSRASQLLADYNDNKW